MLKYSVWQTLRQTIARIPGAATIYNGLRLVFAPSYQEDGLLTLHNADFLYDPRFIAAYETALHQQPGTNIRWRAHVVQWAVVHALHLQGDLVECGVNRAFLSLSAMSFVDFRHIPNKRFFLFDTYCGLVPDLVAENDKAAYRNRYEDTYELVTSIFRDWSNVVIVRGIVPQSLATVAIEKVAYLSIDMNCAKPELEALQFFWPKLVPSAVIVLDDYGFSGHEAQKKAADSFVQAMGITVLSLPTGQGLIIRPPD